MADLIEYVATRWRCPHCRRSYTRRGTALAHEAQCWESPEYRHCRGCAHLRESPANGFTDPTCMKGEDPCAAYSTTEFGEVWTGDYVAHCPLWERREGTRFGWAVA